VRPSGTEPLVRVYFEAARPGTLATLREAVEEGIPSDRA